MHSMNAVEGITWSLQRRGHYLEPAEKGALPGVCREGGITWSLQRRGHYLESAEKGALPGVCREGGTTWSLQRRGHYLESAEKGALPGVCREGGITWSLQRRGHYLESAEKGALPGVCREGGTTWSLQRSYYLRSLCGCSIVIMPRQRQGLVTTESFQELVSNMMTLSAPFCPSGSIKIDGGDWWPRMYTCRCDIMLLTPLQQHAHKSTADILAQMETLDKFGLLLNTKKCEVYWPNGDATFPEFPSEVEKRRDGASHLGAPL